MMVAGAAMRVEEGLNSSGNGGGDDGTAAGAATTDKERTRIYVGGLGESVTEDDLRKTFSTLGKIESVDIVRTKGRSFAYLDFLPSSDKSLPKLFSTYNGCMWKGGRLRLEKAKEHYLIRLRREWQEEAENASDASKGNADASEHTVSSGKPKKAPSSDKMQLQIFFPKLMKVKSVAWSGTGKHKYSFQRVEVPALPVHFCDCEEHYVPPVAKEKTLSTLETASGGINEEEINIMNTVMNKLLKPEDCSKTVVRESNLPNDRDNFDDSSDDLPAGDEEEDHMTDEDNLIINVVAGEKDRIGLLGKQSLDAVMANQKLISNRSQTSKDKPTQNVSDSQKKKSLPRSRRQKPSDSIEMDENGGKSLQLHLTTPDDEALEQDFNTQQMKSNSSWKQKSAWRNLIGHKGNSKFRITDVIPSEASQKEETKTADRDLPSTMDQKEEEPKTVDHDLPCATDKKEEELKTAELDSPCITDMKSKNLENHGDADIQPGQSKDLENPPEAPPAKLKEVSNRVARGVSWLAKSSWTQLVSTTINSPFSISQILPNLSSEKHDQVTQTSVQVVNSADSGQSTLKSVRNEANGDCSDASGLATKELIIAPHPSSVIPLVNHGHNPISPGIEQKFTEEKIGEKSEVPASSLEKNQPSMSKQTALGEFEFSETCPFMRTDTSMKEWRKRKVAQSASLRKKRKDDLE